MSHVVGLICAKLVVKVDKLFNFIRVESLIESLGLSVLERLLARCLVVTGMGQELWWRAHELLRARARIILVTERQIIPAEVA
jgi:hypothetical protein